MKKLIKKEEQATFTVRQGQESCEFIYAAKTELNGIVILVRRFFGDPKSYRWFVLNSINAGEVFEMSRNDQKTLQQALEQALSIGWETYEFDGISEFVAWANGVLNKPADHLA